MGKYLLLGSMTVTTLMMLGGCETNDKYCCESNDLCLSTPDWPNYSCSNETCGHCEKVDPLAIDPLVLPDATIGQSDYRVELTASGGISPYTWSLARGDEEKLKWLTITQEGENKAILHNGTDTNNVPLYPTEMNVGIPLTITLVDSSKHGTAVREDNQGKAFQMTIKINDCPRECEMPDGMPPITGGTKCESNTVYHCNSYFSTSSIDCRHWEDPENCNSQCQNDYISCCINECSKLDIRCLNGQIDNCTVNTLACLAWTKYQDCDPKECNPDGSSCKNCTNECQKSGDRQCSDNKTMAKTCEFNPLTGCLVWAPYEQCADDPKSHCLTTGCINGQCTYRYTIQTNNIDGVNVEEVYDAQTNLYWKRQIEPNNTNPGLYNWNDAKSRCSSPYHLPSIKYDLYANPSKAELDTIIEKGHDAPYINTCAFPNMPDCSSLTFWNCGFWSSSEESTSYAWSVMFETGGDSGFDKTSTFPVRCVRSVP